MGACALTVFVISDTHFYHKNIITFKRDDGSPLRPFTSIEEMNETLVDNWNKVVKPNDKVYHLGDVYLGGSNDVRILGRLNGQKRLVKGNHDKLKPKEYLQYFHDIYGVRHLPGLVMSHVPIHPDSLKRWGLNLHGHLHYNRIASDEFYNCSVECINYTPKAIEDIAKETGRKLL